MPYALAVKHTTNKKSTSQEVLFLMKFALVVSDVGYTNDVHFMNDVALLMFWGKQSVFNCLHNF